MALARRVQGREGGSAYLLALGALLVLAGLGVAAVEMGSLDRRLSTNEIAGREALYAAESAIAVQIARLVEGSTGTALEVEVEGSDVGLVTRVTQLVSGEPSLAARSECESCFEIDGVESESATFELSATGELWVRRGQGALAPRRLLARRRVEARVLLQPWPVVQDEPSAFGGCSESATVRVQTELLAELGGEDCESRGVRAWVAGFDGVSATVCAVPIPLCVRLTDWHEVAETSSG